MVNCNGIPKSGTHALEKAVQLLGQKTQHGHLPYSKKPSHTHILILRHPKNMLVSWVRFIRSIVTQGFLIEAMSNYSQEDAGTFYDEFLAYKPYLTDKDTLVVKYEDLVLSDECIKKIADYLDVPYLDDAFDSLLGMTKTWTGRPSVWQEHWTDEVQKVWENINGPEIEKVWNY